MVRGEREGAWKDDDEEEEEYRKAQGIVSPQTLQG
jgi:hypothetical protein